MKYEEWERSFPEEIRGDSFESDIPYQTSPVNARPDPAADREKLDDLLQNIPL